MTTTDQPDTQPDEETDWPLPGMSPNRKAEAEELVDQLIWAAGDENAVFEVLARHTETTGNRDATIRAAARALVYVFTDCLTPTDRPQHLNHTTKEN